MKTNGWIVARPLTSGGTWYAGGNPKDETSAWTTEKSKILIFDTQEKAFEWLRERYGQKLYRREKSWVLRLRPPTTKRPK